MASENDTFEVYRDKRGEFRWRRKAPNGRIVGAGAEGYESFEAAEANARRGSVETDKWEFYRDRRGEYRWRRKAANGQIVGASIEGAPTLREAKEGAVREGYAPD